MVYTGRDGLTESNYGKNGAERDIRLPRENAAASQTEEMVATAEAMQQSMDTALERIGINELNIAAETVGRVRAPACEQGLGGTEFDVSLQCRGAASRQRTRRNERTTVDGR